MDSVVMTPFKTPHQLQLPKQLDVSFQATQTNFTSEAKSMKPSRIRLLIRK